MDTEKEIVSPFFGTHSGLHSLLLTIDAFNLIGL